MTSAPDDRRYSTDHLWVRVDEQGLARVGVTDFAQESLGDIVAVSPPNPDEGLEPGQACGDIESTKSLSDLISPLRGTVSATNPALDDHPELVNTDPYGQGWLFEALPATDAGLQNLISSTEYTRMTGDN